MINPIKPSSVNGSHIVEKFTKLFLDRKIPLSLSVNCFLIILIDEQGNWNFEL
ncbi:unknown protein [Microcystis aeruginosa NIES-843]|uniref:Uncharacterized protein n=1 Tax=Microcystis aeruginosa (strain NIES-843 / IAM M-2473) TaxID=449447 RepID=B0JW49_MICAN|nr:unknown protein [Microcystis aeruginosa NIES-843]